jgi:16S rRNA (uracil1498-N3)-methyltransferase
VGDDLKEGQRILVTGDQAHYLRHVLRMKAGEALRLFNGRDGEFLARLVTIGKNKVETILEKRLRVQTPGTDLWLCAAPIKKAHFDYMIEKATELGVSVIQPILTERTQIREVNTERCHSMAVEAAEQSERLDIPEIRAPVTLEKLIAGWPSGRIPIICAELGEAMPVKEAFTSLARDATAGVITGPEGGFAEREFEAMRKLPGAVFVRLGPRILRADTATIAALSLWQALCGDWK